MTDDLDTALASLRESLGDLSTLNNIVLSLRRNADRLREPLTTMLHETRDAIDATLAILEPRP